MTTQREKEARLRYGARLQALCALEFTASENLGSYLVEEMLQIGGRLRDQMLRRSEAQRNVRLEQEQVEELKTELLLSDAIDGSNDKVRAAQLAKALTEIPEYQSIMANLRRYQQETDEASAEVEFLTNKLAALKAESRRITAMLTALGSE